MKRHLSFLLAALLLAGLLAGCGDPGAEQSLSREEYSQLAEELVGRYENYVNIGIGCRLDYDWDIEGEEMIALLPEEKRDLVNMPIRAVGCGSYEEALEETYQYIDGSLLDKEILGFTAELCLLYDGELYFFWGNKGLVTYRDTAVEEVTDGGMVVTSNLYSSGGELYEKDRFTVKKENDRFRIVGMEVAEEYL